MTFPGFPFQADSTWCSDPGVRDPGRLRPDDAGCAREWLAWHDEQAARVAIPVTSTIGLPRKGRSRQRPLLAQSSHRGAHRVGTRPTRFKVKLSGNIHDRKKYSGILCNRRKTSAELKQGRDHAVTAE